MTAPARQLATCKACGAAVARNAAACPSCGAHRTRVGNAVAIAGLIAVVIVAVVLVLYGVGHYR